MGLVVTTILAVIFVVIYITILILVTISLSKVNSDDKSDSDSDKRFYDQARTYLGWAVGLGWTLVVLGIISIVLLIVAAIFLLPEVGFATLASVASRSGVDISGLSDASKNKVYKYINNSKNGLFGYNELFGASGVTGFLEKSILIISLIVLFAFGILAALAAAQIAKTTTRRGYSQAIWAAVLGIVPLSIIIIWSIANLFYVSAEKSKARDILVPAKQKRREEILEKKENVGNIKLAEPEISGATSGISDQIPVNRVTI